MTGKITAWSISRFNTWRQCNEKAEHKFIDRLPDPSGPAAERGNVLHGASDDYIGHRAKTLPKEFKHFKQPMAELRAAGAQSEVSVNLTARWTSTGLFSPDTWLRMKIDIRHHLRMDKVLVVDVKSGKMNEGYGEQLELYGVGSMAEDVLVEQVIAQLWYIDQNTVVSKVFHRRDFDKLRKAWEKRVRPMLAMKKFKPNPGNHCRWCPYSKSKGGPCAY